MPEVSQLISHSLWYQRPHRDPSAQRLQNRSYQAVFYQAIIQTKAA